MFGLIDRLLVAACVLLLAAALMALGALGYSFIDQHNSREFHAVATVQAVTYRAPHTSLFLVGKVLVPVRHSASWDITVAVDGERLTAQFPAQCASPGQVRQVTYVVGRLSGKRVLRNIEP